MGCAGFGGRWVWRALGLGVRWVLGCAGSWGALGQARLTGGACFVRVPRPSASSFTSQNKLPRLAVPSMAGRQTTFAGGRPQDVWKGFWHRRAIEAATMPAAGRSRAVGLDANDRSRAHVPFRDRQGSHAAVVSSIKTWKPARDAKFASGPVTSRGGDRGHRRGLDGPSMPNPSTKMTRTSPANVVCRLAMPGTARRGSLFCEVKEEAAGRGTRTKKTPPVSRA